MRSIGRAVRLAGLGGVIAAAALLASPSRPAADEVKLPPHLERVPLDADVFFHVRAGDVIAGPVFQDVRKALGKEADPLLKKAEDFFGVSLNNVETVTLAFPRMPMGPGDEQMMVVVVATKAPYDKEKLLRQARKGEPKGQAIPLNGDMALHLTSDRLFAVMHTSLVEKYQLRDTAKDGPLAATIRLAASGKHTAVGGFNLDALPAEVRSNLPLEVRPFKPLIDARAVSGFVDLGKDLKGELSFHCKNADEAVEAERSWKLLMKLAEDGLGFVLNDESARKEIGPVMPFLKELQTSVKNQAVKVDGSTVRVAAALKGDLPVAQMVKQAVESMQRSTARAMNQNNLKQLGLAMHNYHDTYNGFPPAAICDRRGRPLLSWRVAILPFIEQQALYQQFKLDEPWDSEHNKKLLAKMPRVYMLPETAKPGNTRTHYRLFYGNGAVYDLIQQSKLQEIADGTSNTVMIVEAAEAVEWSKPDDLEYDPKKEVAKLLRFVNDRVWVAFCDGSVRSLSKKVAQKTWNILIEKADGNVLPADFDD